MIRSAQEVPVDRWRPLKAAWEGAGLAPNWHSSGRKTASDRRRIPDRTARGPVLLQGISQVRKTDPRQKLAIAIFAELIRFDWRCPGQSGIERREARQGVQQLALQFVVVAVDRDLDLKLALLVGPGLVFKRALPDRWFCAISPALCRLGEAVGAVSSRAAPKDPLRRPRLGGPGRSRYSPP